MTDAENWMIWANHFGQTVAATSPEPAAVPEPSTATLLLIVGVDLTAPRRWS